MKQIILISAGDHSGDVHGAALAAALRKRNPKIRIAALGGKHLHAAADVFLENLTREDAFGFSAVFNNYRRLKEIFNTRVKKLFASEKKPDVVVLIDYYGFNIHIAKLAHKYKVPVYYYISPQVWASRPERINQLRKYVKEMLVILPFEEPLYTTKKVPARFVGHPLLDVVPPQPLRSVHNPFRNPIIGLFPGSRMQVVKNPLPLLEKAAHLIERDVPDARFKLFLPEAAREAGVKSSFETVYGGNYKDRLELSTAISVSGTVSLENTLLGIPMVVFYKLSWFNYIVARMLVTVPYITMANILLNKEVVPELIQDEARPEKLAAALVKYYKNRDHFAETRRQLLSVRQLLGTPGASTRAAEAIIPSIHQHQQQSTPHHAFNPKKHRSRGHHRPRQPIHNKGTK